MQAVTSKVLMLYVLFAVNWLLLNMLFVSQYEGGSKQSFYLCL